MIDRVHRELTDDDIEQIADTYHAWRGDKAQASTKTCPASARAPARRDPRPRARPHAGPLRGGRGAEDDGEPFDEKLLRLRRKLETHFTESARLEAEIRRNLDLLGTALEAEDGRSGSPE